MTTPNLSDFLPEFDPQENFDSFQQLKLHTLANQKTKQFPQVRIARP